MINRKNNIYIKNPNALVFIYNYQDRLGDSKSNIDPFALDQIILNSVSLKSITTSKSKSNPAGSFEFRLAPTKNWVTAITPGSWCIILISNEKIDDKAKYGGGSVDEKSFKMLGRIESVRGVVNTNQTTGARETEYIVTGSDWGTIFNSKLYIDPINRTPNESAVGMAERFGYAKYLAKNIGYDTHKLGKDAEPVPRLLKKTNKDSNKASVNRTLDFLNNGSKKTPTPPLAPSNITAGESIKDTKVNLPTATDNVNFILELWGRDDSATANTESETGLVSKSKQVFKIPNKLATYMGFVDKSSKVSPTIAQILKQKSGLLTDVDTYSDKDTSSGIINFNTVLGEHTVWQILMNNCNELINELIPEIRFVNNKPTLTLYNRVKPFAINDENTIKKDKKYVGDNIVPKKSEDTIKTLISQYKNVKKIKINIDDVIRCSYGTNWRDRINFIEVNIARSLFQENYAGDIKLDSQFSDRDSIGRDGLLSLMKQTSYVPLKEGIVNPIGVAAYKYILKEWYFNTHKMFNGTLQLIGQDQYIQVGDNIIVDSKVLNSNKNFNLKQIESLSTSYLLAHVESISHEITVDNNGSRVFFTSINFVRGILTDKNGNQLVSNNVSGALDQDTALVKPSLEKNKNTISTSGPNDPDRQKLKGN